MKRLSKIDESVWADMHKRSNGTQIRKEDDIELLDMTELYDYILVHYELTDKNKKMTYGSKNMSITISSEGDEILLSYGFHEVHLFFKLPKYELLETELHKKFNVSLAGNNYDHYIVEPSGKYTNQFFIDVLDCIIANRNTILRKKDNVSESVWTDIHKRSNGDAIRKEDEIGNLHKLKPVDMGGSVYWADADLKYDGKIHFLFDEIQELVQNSGWRLPTRKDIDELDRYCVLKSNKDYLYLTNLYSTNKSQVLTFNRNGMIYNTSVSHGNEMVTYLSEYWGWTSEEVNDGTTIQCFIITDNDVLYTPLTNHYSIMDLINSDRHAKLCVRLVKDK